MPLNLDDKKNIVEDLANVARKATSLVAAEYRGLKVEEMTQLRLEARKKGVTVRVVRNTLARRAFKGTSFECVEESLVGPLVLAFSSDDPGAAARIFRDFLKGHEHLKPKFLSFDGQALEAKQLGKLADLPTLEQALAQLMGVMKAPIEKFVRTLAEPHSQVVRAVAAVRDQKSSGSP